jgi:hypothetical protein
LRNGSAAPSPAGAQSGRVSNCRNVQTGTKNQRADARVDSGKLRSLKWVVWNGGVGVKGSRQTHCFLQE